MPGTLLKDRLAQQGRLSEAAAKKLAIAILKVLCYLHELSPPVLHRDIKPSNLILSDRQLYLVDFGAVQDQPDSAGRSFTVVGTYGYAPLKQSNDDIPAFNSYRSTSPFGKLHTWLVIDRNQFKIYADNRAEITAIGQTAAIHNVFLDQTNNRSAIILQTTDRQYSFGDVLKPGEMRWVIREIRDWLSRVRLGQPIN